MLPPPLNEQAQFVAKGKKKGKIFKRKCVWLCYSYSYYHFFTHAAVGLWHAKPHSLFMFVSFPSLNFQKQYSKYVFITFVKKKIKNKTFKSEDRYGMRCLIIILHVVVLVTVLRLSVRWLMRHNDLIGALSSPCSFTHLVSLFCWKDNLSHTSGN